jgi:hypothetical protein
MKIDRSQFNWPKDPESGRYICTKEKPMPVNHSHIGRLWMHLDADVIEEDGRQGFDEKYKCPHCGVMWWTECDG